MAKLPVSGQEPTPSRTFSQVPDNRHQKSPADAQEIESVAGHIANLAELLGWLDAHIAKHGSHA
jgi:hypothetical protein